MTELTQRKIRETRATLVANYGNYMNFEPAERVLLCMAFLADKVKVREVGTNRGPWVEAILDSAGVGPGNPWCASALTFACKVAEVSNPDNGPAAVRNWRSWFEDLKRLINPKRGAVCMKNSGGGKGHIGIVVKVLGPMVYSIEGNTGAGSEGNQRDGDGLYRRIRTKGFWSWGFGELK